MNLLIVLQVVHHHKCIFTHSFVFIKPAVTLCIMTVTLFFISMISQLRLLLTDVTLYLTVAVVSYNWDFLSQNCDFRTVATSYIIIGTLYHTLVTFLQLQLCS